MRTDSRSSQTQPWRRASAVVTFAVLSSFALIACGGETEAPAEVFFATTEPTPTATETPRSTRTPTATPEPIDVAHEAIEGEPSVISLSAFISEHGYPSDATFARVRIPVLGVDARSSSRYVGGEGQMPNPSGPADLVWYDLSAWDSMGGTPGSGGNAIFSGHVDYNARVRYADVHYRGEGVFGEIERLNNGDIIEVDYNGETFRYAVVWVRQLHATNDDWAPIWRNGGADSVTLYTCGGDFDPVSRSYSDRFVVRAERV